MQDLVNRVDSERTRRRRGAAPAPVDSGRATRRAREQAPQATPRPDDLTARSQSAPSPADRTATTAFTPVEPHDPMNAPTEVLPIVGADGNRARPVKSAPRGPQTIPHKRAKQARMAGRVTLTFFAVIALVATGGGWSYLRATGNSFTQVSALDGNQDDVSDGDMQLGDENYLIVGTDTRAGVNSTLGAGSTDDAEGSRADTVMLVNIPKNRSRVVVVSFPRDLDVTRPKCSGWDNDKGAYTSQTFPQAMGDKLNAVYALGGPRCLVDVVRKMSGLKINHFIGVDFAGFEAMVDQIGGVDVCSTKPIIDGVLGTVLETSGRQHVNGETALNYVRARHVVGEERSDYDRINRQQRFLASLLRGALSGKVLLDPGKLNGFINAFTQHTFVDNVVPQDLLLLGRSLQKMDAGAVTFLTVPTAGTTSYGNEIPRESDIRAIFRAVIEDQPLPGEKKAPEATSSTTAPPPAKKTLYGVTPSTVSVQVSNASGTAGAAARVATKLSNYGFGIYTTTNYAGGVVSSSKVRFSPGLEAEAATVASSIPGASLEEASDLGGTFVELVLGSDFAGTVRTPTEVGVALPSVPIGSPHSSPPVTLPSDLEHMNAADDTCK
ncbi:hypothetical protein GCM10011591_33880 [Nocardia camponoti]|uniref:LytR family transcriptional regulator n=1 Tax=Nocardia camponoti TaxID=1616106 RepID=A0A917QMS5_9NOCA|nr:hypothetical protein GCM10011591_33880 [Nocardia camponoti]